MKKRVSIKDIASKLGVSTTLVSFVLNGQGQEKRVSAEMVVRIMSTAREMNYSPNQIARSLRKGSTNTIGLIVADIANPFFGTLARTIEDEAVRHGFNVIIGSSDENMKKSASLIETFLNRQVDGFIIVPVEGTGEQIATLVQSEIPVVLVDRYFPGMKSVSHVVLDNHQATWDATRYLIGKGYRHISLVAYQSTLIHMSERIRGYDDAMKAGELGDNIRVVRIPYTFSLETMENAMNDLCKANPATDAVFFTNMLISVAGLQCIRRMKLKIPEDLGILGFDEHDVYEFFEPGVSFVKQPLNEMGLEAVGILVDLIRGSAKTSHVELRHEMILRESC